MFRDKFAKRLKELRAEKGISQDELSKAINSSTNTIGMYETGKRMPREDMLERLREFFGCSYDYLFGFSDERNPEGEKEITVFSYDASKDGLLVPINQKVLFQKGDIALKLDSELARLLYPFYLLEDILIFQSVKSLTGNITALKSEKKILIGRVSKSTDKYLIEFLNPSIKKMTLPVEKTEIIGNMVGMVRLLEM